MPLNHQSAVLLGARLRARRLELGLTVKQLVERSGAYLTASYMSHVESGRHTPSMHALRRLASALDIDVDELLSFAGCTETEYRSVSFRRQAAALPKRTFQGLEEALAEATQAEQEFDWQRAAAFLATAMQLMSGNDPRRPGVRGRRAAALAWTGAYEEATRHGVAAIAEIAEQAGAKEAAEYAARLTQTLYMAGYRVGAWDTARAGLALMGERRDAAWVRLAAADLEGASAVETVSPTHGNRWAKIHEVLKDLPQADLRELNWMMHIIWPGMSRIEIATRFRDIPPVMTGFSGELRHCLELWSREAALAEKQNRRHLLAVCYAHIARIRNALGELIAADDAFRKAIGLGAHYHPSTDAALTLALTLVELRFAANEGWVDLSQAGDAFLGDVPGQGSWALIPAKAVTAHVYARAGRLDESRALLAEVMPWIGETKAWAPFFTTVVSSATDALVLLGDRQDPQISLVERSIREKLLPLDYRHPMMDSRRSLGQLSGLAGRVVEASSWFNAARQVLDEQDARPLRAIVDLDEAEMLVGNSERREDRRRALGLVAAADLQFADIGMTGWCQRAAELRKALGP